jgi:hypothetical protein
MALFSSYKYKRVPKAMANTSRLSEPENAISDVDLSSQMNRSRCYLCVYHICCLFIWAALLMIFLWTTWSAAGWIRKASVETRLLLGLHCGSSVIEAKERGCEFDLLSYSWTPSECMDHETAAEFMEWAVSDERKLGAWPFFEDIDAQVRVPGVDSLSNRVLIETRSSQEQHLGHCIFWMRRTDRVKEGKGKITARGDGLNHAIHCTESLLDRLRGPRPEDEGKAHAVFSVGFNTC